MHGHMYVKFIDVMMNIMNQYMLQGYDMDVTKYRLLLYRQKNRNITGNILHV